MMVVVNSELVDIYPCRYTENYKMVPWIDTLFFLARRRNLSGEPHVNLITSAAEPD